MEMAALPEEELVLVSLASVEVSALVALESLSSSSPHAANANGIETRNTRRDFRTTGLAS
jgi:hypothetical protein